MHPNFYHWHARVDMATDVDVLEKRWDAAAAALSKPSRNTLESTLGVLLAPGRDPSFSKWLTEGILKHDPTFPIENQEQLLRVMAAAGLYSIMEEPSSEADSVALGLRAADYPAGRGGPVAVDVSIRASEYLADEADRVRPSFESTNARKQLQGLKSALQALEKILGGEQAPINKALHEIGSNVASLADRTLSEMESTTTRLAEETNVLWWLVGQRSPILERRRADVPAHAYAVPAAIEAADLVALLPPSASMETLIAEVLAQCGTGDQARIPLHETKATLPTDGKVTFRAPSKLPELTPVTALLAVTKASGEPPQELLERTRLPLDTTVTPVELAIQYFRELVFLRSLQDLK